MSKLVLNTALLTAQSGLTPHEASSDPSFRGRLVESAVGAHLTNAASGCEVFYWRDRNREVDFVVKSGRRLTALEVKSGRRRDGLPGLEAFAAVFRPDRKLHLRRPKDNPHFSAHRRPEPDLRCPFAMGGWLPRVKGEAGVKTDAPLKVLFRKYARDLLGLLGDAGASLVAVENVEIQQIERRVDGLLKLERQGEVYYRHVEFQAEDAPDVARRCFEYNALLLMRYGAPVLTTVVYLFPPGPRADPVFRVAVGGREVNRWRFDVVRLWELDATVALDQGGPGFLSLLPLMRGGADLGLLERAARRIEEAFPGEACPEAEEVLIYLAGRHYTFEELDRTFGREKMIQSSVSQHFWSEGRSEGLKEGRLEAEREVCLRMVLEYHPALVAPATVAIQRSADPARLAEWIVSAPRLADDEFARLLSIE